MKLKLSKNTDRLLELVPKFRLPGFHYVKEDPILVDIEKEYSSLAELNEDQVIDFKNDLLEFYTRQAVVDVELIESKSTPKNDDKKDKSKDKDSTPKSDTKVDKDTKNDKDSTKNDDHKTDTKTKDDKDKDKK